MSRFPQTWLCLVVFGVHVRLTESLKNHRRNLLEPMGSRPAWSRHFWGSHPLPVKQTVQTSDYRQHLRQELRAKRQALTPSQQAAASEWLLRQLMKVPQFMRAQHIALYWAMDGEIDLLPVAQQLWKMGKQCYLPVIHPSQVRKMWFVEYTPETILIPNKYKIPEPNHHTGRKLAPQLLDAVLLPLVGFDATGARLGMGGGYYDTTFAFKQQKPNSKPWLLGVAHECQQVEKLETAEWDIPLHAVVTDKQIFI